MPSQICSRRTMRRLMLTLLAMSIAAALPVLAKAAGAGVGHAGGGGHGGGVGHAGGIGHVGGIGHTAGGYHNGGFTLGAPDRRFANHKWIRVRVCTALASHHLLSRRGSPRLFARPPPMEIDPLSSGFLHFHKGSKTPGRGAHRRTSAVILRCVSTLIVSLPRTHRGYPWRPCNTVRISAPIKVTTSWVTP